MSVLEAHPHAAAVLGAALRTAAPRTPTSSTARPARASARPRARSPPSCSPRDAPDPENAKARTRSGVHPDLTWVAPSGAHIMLRGDVDQSVVAAAGHTPFEAS